MKIQSDPLAPSPFAGSVYVPPKSRATGQSLRGRQIFWVVQALLALLLSGVTGGLMLHLQTATLGNAAHEARSLSLVLADQAERAFEAVDLAQVSFLSRVHAENIETEAQFKAIMASPATRDALQAENNLLPQLDELALVDTEGNIINFSRKLPAHSVNVAGRSDFQQLSSNSAGGSYVSGSFANMTDSARVVIVARRITSRNATFLGTSFAGVLMEYFERLYKMVGKDTDLIIALSSADGVPAAHYPEKLPLSRAQPTMIDEKIAHKIDSFGPDVVRQFNARDGQDYLIAVHKLNNYPMRLSVSRKISSILASWRNQAIFLGFMAALLQAAAFYAGLLLMRMVRHREQIAMARAIQVESEAAQRAAEAEKAAAAARAEASREIQSQNRRFSAALDNMSQALCMFDETGELIVANRRLADMFGLDPVLTGGVTWQNGNRLFTAQSNLPPHDFELLHGQLTAFWKRRKKGAFTSELSDGRSVSVNFVPMRGDGALITIEDMTERKEAEAKIAHLANHDALTGLPNRSLFHQRLTEELLRIKRGGACAILFLGLDRFKNVNDTLGHSVGDALLRDVTTKLRTQMRETDMVARLGGDEFGILQSNIEQPHDATALASRLIKMLGAAFLIDQQYVTIGVSIGIVMAPFDGSDPDHLLKSADLALYRAKADGRGCYRFFEPEMNALAQHRRALELDMRAALNFEQFEVYYQPQVHLKTRKVCGFEALIRWRHAERGMISPGDFIPLAEEIGLIQDLGIWVLRRACLDAAEWPTAWHIAVNLSPVQFSNRTLVQDVEKALQDSGLAPGRLELEITETAMLKNTESVLNILHQLRALGVAIAMDDFGTGYSSLSYLRIFPFDKVKIDRSFITGLGQDAESDAIISAITGLCVDLGMSTTAEGVETQLQLDHLARTSCTEVQGFYYSPARPASELDEMMALIEAKEVVVG